MLACMTESEPLCLIVEYCNNGDLLHYLRERCKYMMKLDDLSINYHEPPNDENYDPNMIITLKQLLQFAVQISYGLVGLPLFQISSLFSRSSFHKKVSYIVT